MWSRRLIVVLMIGPIACACLRPGAILASCGQLKKISGPIGDAVIDELVERGLVRRRFDVPLSAAG
jgi:hypothetical protein